MTVEISVVIVSYNTCAMTSACIDSLLRSDFGPMEIIVVDNASSDGTVERIGGEFPEVVVVANPDNRGFTKANNQGFRMARGKRIWMLNSDTEVYPDSARVLATALDEQGGIVTPTLLSSDGALDNSRRVYPTLGWQFLHVMGLVKLFARYEDRTATHQSDCQVDWAPGASLMFSRELYERIGGLDERFFMFCEEVDFCLRALQVGARTRFIHRANVIHHEGKSCAALRKPTYLQSKWSMYLYFKKHVGGAQAMIYMALACFEALTRSARLFLIGKGSLRGVFDLTWSMCRMFLSQTPPLGAS